MSRPKMGLTTAHVRSISCGRLAALETSDESEATAAENGLCIVSADLQISIPR